MLVGEAMFTFCHEKLTQAFPSGVEKDINKTKAGRSDFRSKHK